LFECVARVVVCRSRRFSSFVRLAADVLESIADTVLQLVLFQVEAKENESTLVRLDVAPLLSSIKFLVDLAKRKAQRWTEVGEKKNQSQMLKACATMAEATSKIDEGLETLRKDPFDVKVRRGLVLFVALKC
jgi:hypothetical protein